MGNLKHFQMKTFDKALLSKQLSMPVLNPKAGISGIRHLQLNQNLLKKEQEESQQHVI
jgi:hypothetical protein